MSGVIKNEWIYKFNIRKYRKRAFMLYYKKQKKHPGVEEKRKWLSDQAFAKKFGFEVVDSTDDGYELLALSFDETKPKFAQSAKKQKIENKDLTIYYDMQCPYIYQSVERIKQYCKINNIPLSLIQIKTLKQAKELPGVFNNWCIFYKGNLKTVNLLDSSSLEKILQK